MAETSQSQQRTLDRTVCSQYAAENLMGLSEAARLLPEKLAEKGWSQADLKRRMDNDLGHVAEGLVSRWTKGTREPSGSQVGWLERELGLPAILWAKPAASSRTSRRRRAVGG